MNFLGYSPLVQSAVKSWSGYFRNELGCTLYRFRFGVVHDPSQLGGAMGSVFLEALGRLGGCFLGCADGQVRDHL